MSLKLFRYKWNNITKLALIFFFSNFYLPILTLFYQQRGLSIFQINSLQAILIGTIFFTNIPTGIFADKYGRKLTMIIALSLQLLGEILFLFAYGYLAFVFICIIAGLGFSFMTGTVSALIYETLKREQKENEMQKAVGTKVAFEKAAGIIAPLAASFYITSFAMSRFNFLVIVTIIFVAISLIVAFFLEETIHIQEIKKKTSSLTIIKEGLILLKENSNLKRIILLSILAYPLMAYLFILYQPYFVKSHVPSYLFGIFLAITSLVSLLSSKYTYKLEQRFGMEKTVLFVTLLPGIIYVIMAFIFHPLLSPLLFCLIYFPIGMYEPLFSDYQNRHIESENRATVLSMISMFSNIYIVVIGLLIGLIADRSISLAFIFMGLMILFSSIAFRLNKSHILN
jgi:MFS family permease